MGSYVQQQMTALQRLAAARMIAVQRLQYLAHAILTLVPYEAPGLGTEAVTHDGIFMWDPIRWETLDVEDGTTGVAHEVLHIVLDTHGRAHAIAADFGLFNIAADAIINGLLRAAGFRLLPTDVTVEGLGLPSEAENWSAEQIYRELEKRDPKQPNKPQCRGGWCGSGGGRKVPGEPEGDKKEKQNPGSGSGEDKQDARGRSKVDLDRMRAVTAQAVQESAEKARGTVPLGMERWAAEILTPPKVRWQDRLRRISRGSVAYHAGAVEHTFTRRSRRQQQGADQPILPGSWAPIPNVLLVVDTSGSMSEKQLGIIVREVSSIFKGCGVPEIGLISIDAEIHEHTKVRDWKQLASKMKGGGGTDFRPAFERIAQMKKKPHLVIFGTDGYGPAPEVAPQGFETVWLLVGQGAAMPATWGHEVRVED